MAESAGRSVTRPRITPVVAILNGYLETALEGWQETADSTPDPGYLPNKLICIQDHVSFMISTRRRFVSYVDDEGQVENRCVSMTEDEADRAARTLVLFSAKVRCFSR